MNYNGHDKWTAGSGTTITAGIAAAVAGASLISGGNGLGGLFGGSNKMQEVLSENAMLKAEKSTDENSWQGTRSMLPTSRISTVDLRSLPLMPQTQKPKSNVSRNSWPIMLFIRKRLTNCSER